MLKALSRKQKETPSIHIEELVFVTFQLEGLHHWPECPFEEVAYLRDLHRHMFHFKATKRVTHSDRDVEFIMLKHQMIEHLEEEYWDDDQKCLMFGSMSCEMIGKELIEKFDLTEIEVSEDGENGAILKATPATKPKFDPHRVFGIGKI